MGQSKYRKQLNKVLDYVERTQPLLEKYEEQYSGSKNNYQQEQAKKLMEKIEDSKDWLLRVERCIVLILRDWIRKRNQLPGRILTRRISFA
ncbi:MAG: hypothetical protein ACLTCI_09630 [[Clostridium] nexile]